MGQCARWSLEGARESCNNIECIMLKMSLVVSIEMLQGRSIRQILSTQKAAS